jgi:dienelactone hydrolase
MKRLIYISLICFIMPGFSHGADFSRAGNVAVAESTVVVARPDQSTFDALLFQPVTSNTTYGIAFGHGFLSPPELYNTTCRHLASWGYTVIAPRSALELFPSHAAYADDLSYCLTWLEAANTNAASPLFGRISSAGFGITGHSMGGGACLLAAAQDPRIIAVAPMAAAETRPSAIEASSMIDAPVCFITGSEDAFVPNPFHTKPMFQQVAGPTAWFDIKGGYHCGFIRAKLPEFVCDEGSISRFDQIAETHQLITAFFELTLKKDASAWDSIWGPAPDLDRDLTVRRKAAATIGMKTGILRIPSSGSFAWPVSVTNSSLESRSFQLTAAAGTFPVVIDKTQTAVLAPGASEEVHISISAPPGKRPKNGVLIFRAISSDLASGGDYAWGLLRAGR